MSHDVVDSFPGLELRWDGDRVFLDELVAQGVQSVHFEAMGDAQFWLRLKFFDGRAWHINCGAKNPAAKGYAFAEEE